VFLRKPGDWIAVGDAVAEIVDPLRPEVTVLSSRTEGLMYARETRRYVHAGASVCKIAGQLPFRSGKLLSD